MVLQLGRGLRGHARRLVGGADWLGGPAGTVKLQTAGGQMRRARDKHDAATAGLDYQRGEQTAQ